VECDDTCCKGRNNEVIPTMDHHTPEIGEMKPQNAEERVAPAQNTTRQRILNGCPTATATLIHRPVYPSGKRKQRRWAPRRHVLKSTQDRKTAPGGRHAYDLDETLVWFRVTLFPLLRHSAVVRGRSGGRRGWIRKSLGFPTSLIASTTTRASIAHLAHNQYLDECRGPSGHPADG
jgi:hypothetical protein